MNQLDVDRVEQARQRLQSAARSPHHDDPAIRLVELTSPRVEDAALELHRSFCVVSGLAEPARRALADTIDALRLGDPQTGLSGIVEARGRRTPLHAARREPRAPGTSLVATRPFATGASHRTAEATQLAEVINTIDRAVLLSGAELRGADAAAQEIRDRLPESPTSTELAIPELEDARRTLAALDEVSPPVEIVEHIARVLRVVEANPERISLTARRSQAEGARGQVLPGDSRNVAMLADLAIAEADGAIAEFDMRPQSDASLLASSLDLLSIETTPASAPLMAKKVLDECEELDQIRRKAQEVIDSARAPIAADDQLRLDTIDQHRSHIQRRLRSQQQLLAAAREQWAIIGVGELDLRTHIDLVTDTTRPLPILVEEPLADLPMRLSGAIMSTLLRHSNATQVICVSDQSDLHTWCDSVGDRAGWVAATGWFAEPTM